ncbi:adenylate kinase-like [Mercenaria mercenaria]|uniref:adenylate kinase-like n=1 Tax=Mercenaria mercenaria TaxID=6596 RepID=UPI00234F726F|nr:adenylate kinase-like [Mercenaria mercenaria]
MAIQRIGSNKLKGTTLISGFPRSLSQAEALHSSGLAFDIVLNLNIPDHIIIDRIKGSLKEFDIRSRKDYLHESILKSDQQIEEDFFSIKGKLALFQDSQTNELSGSD